MTKETKNDQLEEDTLETQESQPKKRKLSKKHKLSIASVVIIIIAILGVGIAWLYTGQLTEAKVKIFRSVPLPVALVNTKHITSTQLFERIDLAKKILENSGQPTTGIESQLLDQLIETNKINVVATANNIDASSEDIENSYKAILKKFPNNNESDFEKTLFDTYGMDLATFKTQVIRQSVLQENLKLWFNQQESLNGEQYNKARELITQLDTGTSFEEVAKKYSQDTATKDFAGDSGFVKYGDMLPEFKLATKDLAIGNTKIVASRFGVHVLKVNAIEGDSSNQDERTYNLHQIFIQPADFSSWLKTQTNNVRTVKLL